MQAQLTLKISHLADTEIFLSSGLLKSPLLASLVQKVSKEVAIITDARVKTLYGENLKSLLNAHGIRAELFSFPEGEIHKTRHSKQLIEDRMLEKGFTRNSALIALGGGVVTDLAGYVAATYCRGIPFFSIPTTLLAMVDASVGGKVGVNTPHAKNIIGTYYHPRFVLIDIETLKTLSLQELLNGLAEVIKYALIAAPELFEKIQIGSALWKSCDPSFLSELILQGLFIKKTIVEQDPQESGLRRLLNFGHTIGHAIEAVSNYQISHGVAISIGMLSEAYMSVLEGYLEESAFRCIVDLFQQYPFSLSLPENFDFANLQAAMAYDKKADSRKIRFVLLKKIGKVMDFDSHYCCTVKPQVLKETLSWMQKTFCEKIYAHS